jgi:hypothetical protein
VIKQVERFSLYIDWWPVTRMLQLIFSLVEKRDGEEKEEERKRKTFKIGPQTDLIGGLGLAADLLFSFSGKLDDRFDSAPPGFPKAAIQRQASIMVSQSHSSIYFTGVADGRIILSYLPSPTLQFRSLIPDKDTK